MDEQPEPDAPALPQLAIITGLSGAGRTTAAKALEDVGFFVIDNLPPTLIGKVADLATVEASVRRVALVVDVRGRELFGDLRKHLDDLRTRDLDLRVLYLQADDDVLVARYEEARRRHPLSGSDRVIDGIRREKGLLADLRADADLVVDTSDMNVHELRHRLTDAFGGDGSATLVVNVVSFGFKYGTPRDAAIVLDVRFLPNPHWVPSLRPHTGLDPDVREYVLTQPLSRAFLDRLLPLFDLMIPAFVEDGKRYLTVAIGCTGGRHRSVAIAEHLGQYLQEQGVSVNVDHRDAGTPARSAAQPEESVRAGHGTEPPPGVAHP